MSVFSSVESCCPGDIVVSVGVKGIGKEELRCTIVLSGNVTMPLSKSMFAPVCCKNVMPSRIVVSSMLMTSASLSGNCLVRTMRIGGSFALCANTLLHKIGAADAAVIKLIGGPRGVMLR